MCNSGFTFMFNLSNINRRKFYAFVITSAEVTVSITVLMILLIVFFMFNCLIVLPTLNQDFRLLLFIALIPVPALLLFFVLHKIVLFLISLTDLLLQSIRAKKETTSNFIFVINVISHFFKSLF